MNKKFFLKLPMKIFQITVALLLFFTMTINPSFAYGYKWSQNFQFYYSESRISDQLAVQAVHFFEDSLRVFKDYGFRWYRGWPYPGDDQLTVHCYEDSVSQADPAYIFPEWNWHIDLAPTHVDAKQVILHELFHTVQFSHPGVLEVFGKGYCYPDREDWILEGQARMMQDKTFTDLDLSDGSETASYWGEMSNYLHNTHIPLRNLSYKACLFWTYFTEKYGSVTTEPGYGIDALVEWWDHSSDEYGAMENMRRALNALTEPDVSFSQVWEDFIVANYVKDLDDAPSKYQYIDQDQYAASGVQLPSVWRWRGETFYWEPGFPRVGFEWSEPLTPDGRIEGSGQVDEWAARYYRMTPRSGVDLVHFRLISNHDLSYYLVKAKDDRFIVMNHYYGDQFDTSIGTGDCDEIVLIVGGLERGSNYHYIIESLTPMIDVTWPTTESPALVEGDPPLRDFELNIRVTDQWGRPIRGLRPDVFDITVGLPHPDAAKLPVTILQFLRDPPGEADYWFLIRPPRLYPWYDVSSVQFYDLDVEIGDVVITESQSLDYGIHEPAPQPLLMNLFLTPYLFALDEEKRDLQGKSMIIRVSLAEKEPVIEADAIAEITTPSISTPVAILPPENYSIILYDDGAHEDGVAGDGIYANIFYKTSRPGTYAVKAKAEGVIPELGSFVKTVNATFNLEAGLDMDGDGLPNWWEWRMGLDPAKPVGDQGAAGDPDMDGLNNTIEFKLGTHPLDSDTDNGGESDKSECIASRDPCDPCDDTMPAVEDFDVKPGNDFNLVVYTPRPEYQTMLIWRSTNPQSGFELIAEGSYQKGIFNDTMVDNWVTYYYKIAAGGSGGEMTRIEDSESATPKTDVEPPRGSVSINHGEKFTNSLDVELALNAELDTTHMMISNDPRFTEAQWEPYQTSRSWRLQRASLQTVYARYRDSAGNIGDEVHDGIIVDMTPPIIGTPTQNPKHMLVEPYQNVSVTVEITDEGAGVREVILSYSTDEGQTFTNATMNNMEGNTYVGEIPGAEANTHMQYQIIAYDNADNPTGTYYSYTIIPEFPRLIIWIFIITTLVATILTKSRKRPPRALNTKKCIQMCKLH